MLSSTIRFPHEFAAENLRILHHLNENVENWAAPWDQVVFNYWISVFHVFYVAVIVAVAVTLLDALQTKSLNLLFVLAWAAGVMTPHLLATSKTMTATLVGWPAAWIMLGYLVSSAVKGDRLALGAWLASMACAVLMIDKSSIPHGGEHWGEIPPGFGVIMREHLWVIWQAAISLAAGGLLHILPTHKKIAPEAKSRSTINVGSAPRTISPEEKRSGPQCGPYTSRQRLKTFPHISPLSPPLSCSSSPSDFGKAITPSATPTSRGKSPKPTHANPISRSSPNSPPDFRPTPLSSSRSEPGSRIS